MNDDANPGCMPSKRLVQAARAEREKLIRHHNRLASERDRHQALADAAAVAAQAARQRLTELASLVGDPELALIPAVESSATDVRSAPPNALIGPEIRRTAVRAAARTLVVRPNSLPGLVPPSPRRRLRRRRQNA